MARMIQALLAIVVALFALTEHGCKKKCSKVVSDFGKKIYDEKNSKEQDKICREAKEELKKCKAPNDVYKDMGMKTKRWNSPKLFDTCKNQYKIDLSLLLFARVKGGGHFMEVSEGHQVPSPKEEHGEREVHQVPSFKEQHGDHDEKAEGEAKWENESQRMSGGEAQGQRMPGAVERHQAHLKIDS